MRVRSWETRSANRLVGFGLDLLVFVPPATALKLVRSRNSSTHAHSPVNSPNKGGSCTAIRRRFKAIDCLTSMVRDQEVSNLFSCWLGQIGAARRWHRLYLMSWRLVSSRVRNTY